MKQKLFLSGFLVLGLQVANAAEMNGSPGYGANSANWAIYEDSQYGFKIQYPKDLTLAKTFHGFYLAADNWRIDQNGESGIGKPVLVIPVVNSKNLQGGLYYSAELRIGVSSDPIALENCLKDTKGTKVINGIVFHQANFYDEAMMQYLSGISYRVIYNNQCFALEEIKSGSLPQDENDTNQLQQLKAIENSYPSMDTILQTFVFTR